MARAKWLTLGVLILFGFLISGCKPKEGTNTSAPSASSNDDSESATIAANMAKLSPEDRAIAEKQKTCPVSGAALGGSMGVPYKVSVKGRDVFLCCEGCEETIKEDPDKYLAKLSE